MILCKCPLRVSLVGGSTDTKSFLQKYKRGSVISFTPNLFTYASIHKNNEKKYIVNYSKKEVSEEINEIENELIKYCFEYFSTPNCTITLNTDILSTGSGLASSSSFIISVVKALCLFQKIEFTNKQICDIAFEIEQKINPLAGYQDVYGCGVGNFKRIDFTDDGHQVYKFLDMSFITNNHDMYLLNTGITRSSTNILKTIDIDKSKSLLQVVDNMEDFINKKNEKGFFKMLNDGWNIKKQTSKSILGCQELLLMEKTLLNSKMIDALKLCGAGGGGYFLLFVSKKHRDSFKDFYRRNFVKNPMIKIKIENNGPIGVEI